MMSDEEERKIKVQIGVMEAEEARVIRKLRMVRGAIEELRRELGER